MPLCAAQRWHSTSVSLLGLHWFVKRNCFTSTPFSELTSTEPRLASMVDSNPPPEKENDVVTIAQHACFLGTLVLAAGLSARPAPQSDPAAKEPSSIVITFKDGHRETFPMADIARVEYRDVVDSSLGQDYFLGEW